MNFKNAVSASSESKREFALFGILVGAGVLLYFLRVKIPYTEVFIDGRMVAVFCGAVLMQHWRMVSLLALVLAFPFFSEVHFLVAWGGNLAYVIPGMALARVFHSRFLKDLENSLVYALAWFLLVMICYQLFNTPVVWGVLALITNQPVLPSLLEGWRLQPFFIESLLVATSTSMLMFGARGYYREQQSRKELLITLNSISEGVIATDGAGRVTRMNPFAQEMTGWQETEAKGRRLEEVFVIVDAGTGEPVSSPVEEVLRSGRVVSLANDTVLVARDGERRQIADGAAPIRDERGTVHGVVLVFRDVTMEYRTVKELREAEHKYRQVLEHAIEAIFVVHDGVICFANDKTGEILGVGDPARERFELLPVIEVEDRQQVALHYREALEQARPKTVAPFRISRESGTPLWVELTLVPIDWNGQPAVLSFLRDVTDLKKLQRQLQQAQKMEAIGNLAGGVAHDYNNISSVIIGYTEMIMERFDPTAPEYAELQEILAAANRSADITRQLLAFARQQTVEPRVLDLNQTLEQMLKMLQRLIGEDISLSWRPGSELWPVRIDPTQVDPVLANLCVNARDAITHVGQISIETATVSFDGQYCEDHPGFLPGDYVMLAVSDNGCGMSAEDLTKVFEPFYTTKGSGKGTGLGLATVYGIIKQNNGFVNVYSEPGEGTTIRLYFPRFVGEREDISGIPEPEEPVGGDETILVVEDDAAILNLARIILERLGYTVLTASTPGDGERVARSYGEAIDLLITDVIMPEMNGRDLATTIQRFIPALKVLYMSGYTANVIAHSGVLEAGVCFLQKPFSQRNLATKVRQALANTGTLEPE